MTKPDKDKPAKPDKPDKPPHGGEAPEPAPIPPEPEPEPLPPEPEPEPDTLPDTAAILAMFAAGVDVSGGKTYRLLAGAYGDVTIPAADFSSNPISIEGDPEATTFTSLTLDYQKGVTWRDFNVDGEPGAPWVVYLNVCEDVTLEGVTCVAANFSGGGFYFDTCLRCHAIGRAEADHPDIANRGLGGTMIDCTDCEFLDLTVTGTGPDGFLIAGGDRNTVEACLDYNHRQQTPDDHCDFIQAFISTRTNNPAQHLTIIHNGYIQGAGAAAQGYFVEWSSNLIIEDNYLLGGLYNSIGVSGGSDNLIRGNFLQGYPQYGSRIMVSDGSLNARVEDNAAGAIVNYATGQYGPNPGFQPDPLPGSNTEIPAVEPGDYADLDTWLVDNPDARPRPSDAVLAGAAGAPQAVSPPWVSDGSAAFEAILAVIAAARQVRVRAAGIAF